MKANLYSAILFSIIIHAALITGILFFRPFKDVPYGNSEYIAVEVIKSGDTHKPTNLQTYKPTNLQTFEDGPATNPGDSIGTSTQYGSPAGNPILSKIRTKIERAKYYPPEARRQKIEGNSKITFQITKEGGIASVNIAQSSGSQLLDNAAIKTIHRATPLPYYESPISLAIKFKLQGD